MKKLCILLCTLAGTFMFAQETDYTKLPQLQTQATFTTEVVPDLITLSITLSEENTKGKVSVEELENRLIKVLEANHIDLKTQLKLNDLSSDFKAYFLRKTDIQKTKNYLLELHDAQTTAAVLSGLENQQVSNVQLKSTAYTKLEELKIELKGKAVAKAKRQAEEMVNSLGQKLGSAIFISDAELSIDRGDNAFNGIFNRIEVGNVSMPSDLMVDFNKMKISVSVTVFFKLE